MSLGKITGRMNAVWGLIKVPIDKIGAIIGPGGKNIRALQEETETKIDINDDGTV